MTLLNLLVFMATPSIPVVLCIGIRFLLRKLA